MEQLRYALETARHGSFSAAAEALYISQPSLSAAVKKLEESLGEPIFIRHSTGVTLTPFGESVLPYMRDALAVIDRMPNQIYGRSTRGKPRLSVCNGGYVFMIDPVTRIYEAHREEGICIDYHDVSREKSLDMVASGVAQVGAYAMYDFQKEQLMRRLEAREVQFSTLTVAAPTVTLGPRNPLYHREEDWVTLDMVRRFPLIYDFTEHTVSLFKRLGLLTTFNVITCTERAGRKELLDRIDCISIGSVPVRAYRDGEFGRKRRVFRLRDMEYHAEVGYITRQNTPLSPIAEEFVSYLKELFL